MKRIWSGCLILALVLCPLPVKAQQLVEGQYVTSRLATHEKQSWQHERGKELQQIPDDRIRATQSSVVVEEDEAVVGNAKVYFGTKLLTNREDYTIKKEEGQVVVKFTHAFRESQKPGKYNVYIQLEKHSAELTFELEDTDGYYTAEPPRTKKK